MANGETITTRIKNIGNGSNPPGGTIFIEVDWVLGILPGSGIPGAGTFQIEVDATLNKTQIENAVAEGLAVYITNHTGNAFVASDVNGGTL